MAEADAREIPESWAALGVRTDVPHPARVYNYLLGGHDNVAADRDAAEISLRLLPEIRDSARQSEVPCPGGPIPARRGHRPVPRYRDRAADQPEHS